jgi:hypothetical protein
MITVTKKEFFNFIKLQPDDKEVDFDECKIACEIGCPMIQYAREVFLKIDNVYVSYYGWLIKVPIDGISVHEYIPFASFEDNFTFSSFCLFDQDDLGETTSKTTYGKLKAHLSQKHPDFDWN